MLPTHRIATVLAGGRPDRQPVALHNFLHAARRCGITQATYRSRPAELARVMLATARDFALDGVMVDMDTAVLAEVCGATVDHPEDMPARVHHHRFATPGEVRGLAVPDVAAHPRVQAWVEGVRLLKHAAGDHLWVRGNCDQAAFSLAAMLCQPEAFLMALADPDQEEDLRALLDWCHQVSLQMLTAMAASGCDALSNGDSTGGPDVVSPRMYRRWVMPYQRGMAAHARSCLLYTSPSPRDH
jgi:uroporphyrinogen-III decarboxylase